MLIAAVFMKGKGWKQLVFIMNEWINKLWHIHTMMYYSVIKRNEVLIYATVWMNLENMVNERNQIQNTIHYLIYFYEMFREGKSLDTKKLMFA